MQDHCRNLMSLRSASSEIDRDARPRRFGKQLAGDLVFREIGAGKGLCDLSCARRYRKSLATIGRVGYSPPHFFDHEDSNKGGYTTTHHNLSSAELVCRIGLCV